MIAVKEHTKEFYFILARNDSFYYARQLLYNRAALTCHFFFIFICVILFFLGNIMHWNTWLENWKIKLFFHHFEFGWCFLENSLDCGKLRDYGPKVKTFWKKVRCSYSIFYLFSYVTVSRNNVTKKVNHWGTKHLLNPKWWNLIEHSQMNTTLPIFLSFIRYLLCVSEVYFNSNPKVLYASVIIPITFIMSTLRYLIFNQVFGLLAKSKLGSIPSGVTAVGRCSS